MTTSDDTPTRPRRPVAAAAATVLVGASLLVFAPFLRGSAEADSSAFTGFNFAAVADTVAVTGGDPGNQGFPQVQFRLAHAESQLNTGPTAYAMSSVWWPGSFVGNAGSLTGAFGAPPSFATLNYPVRAEAHSTGDNEVRNDPGMRAFARGELAEAETHYGRYDAVYQGVGFRSLSTHTRSWIEGDIGYSRAESVLQGISLLGGQITIDELRTVAETSTDGESGTHDGSTVIKGMSIGGLPASIDEDGIRFGTNSADDPADPIAQQLGEEALSRMGMDLTYVGPQIRDDGATQEYRTGALLIHWDVGDQNRGIGTVALGGAFASVQAYPAFVFTPPTFPPVTAPPVAAPPTFDPFPVVEDFDTTSDFAPAPDPGPATPLGAGGQAPVAAAPTLIQTDPIGSFEGITPAAILAALAGALVMGRGLRRLQLALVSGAGASCDIEGGPA